MDDWLTDGDMERISAFVSTPEYERDPEMLLPDTDD